ncbi:hypothetical protein DSO57_1031559 [Entomophthora muscae]|uniref:Uncharacterized protein n=1 Tax=Entomophthora muscae TaxID=34485 RepID=A0ACC2TBS2_9FUNG|nr:hypothetical protein DSO57_1031559 [Entomophthora muscae]
MHLTDVCLYNFGSVLRRLKPVTYNKLCTQIDKSYELFPSVFVQQLFDLIIFYASDSDKSRKDPHLPPRQSICFVKPVYMMEEEFEQLKKTALASPSQSENPASPTPSSSHPRSNPMSQATTNPPTISDAVPFTGADEGNCQGSSLGKPACCFQG